MMMIFANNKLKPILVNATDRNNAIQDKTTSKIKSISSFIKTLLILLFSLQLANAIDWSNYTLDNCYDMDITDDWGKGSRDKCINSQYGFIDERLNRVYKQVINSLSNDNKTKLIQKQRAWLKERDKLCAELDDNGCINETMKKVAELSELDKQLNKHKFEGKWARAFMIGYKYDKVSAGDFVLHIPGVFGHRHFNYGGNTVYAAEHYFLIENGENICGIWGFEADNSRGKAIYRAEDSLYARSVKVYIEKGNETKAFADWDIDSGETVSAVTYQQRGTNIRQKTPFAPGEKEKLIKENKWLQDCLNYKGE
jgi:uncharacterized protein YecT (DUF1311 family)